MLQSPHSRCTVGDVGLPPGGQIREQSCDWLRFLRIPNDGGKD